MLADPFCWSALAVDGETVQGIVTVSTVLYVEWGRLGEIGDLYVLQEHRRKGLARRLVEHAKSWCRTQGCSAVSAKRESSYSTSSVPLTAVKSASALPFGARISHARPISSALHRSGCPFKVSIANYKSK